MIQISRAITTTEKQHIFEPHCHNGYEIIYCLGAGKNRIVIEGEHFYMRPWHLYCSPERKYHFVELDVSVPYHRYILNFAAEDCDLCDEDLQLLFATPVKSARGHSDVTALFETLARESVSPSPRREILQRSFLNQLLYRLFDLKSGTSGETSPLVSRLIDYVNNNLSEDLSLTTLAEQLFIDKFHLCHVFREVMGTGISQFVQRKRIITAQNLIRMGTRPTVAAERVGFGDYSTFYRAYRKLLGLSPAHEKQNSKKN